ncbi:MAG TPA: galactose oxidase [Chryseosolibacter sp.]
MTRFFKPLLAATWMLCLAFGFSSCDDSDENGGGTPKGNWSRAGYFEGQPRAGAVSAVIGSKVYIGLGYDGDVHYQDFFCYDAEKDIWENVPPFKGIGRERAVAFSANGKLYVGLGYNRELDTEELDDFWEYDPATRDWTELASFPGTPRYNAVAFTLNNIGYVGTGYDGSYTRNDFYSFDPQTGTWQEVSSFRGGKRESAIAVVIDNKAYVTSGRNNGTYVADIWEFDGTTQLWSEITPDNDTDYFDEFSKAVKRHAAVGFALDGEMYITTGLSGATILSTTFSFDPASSRWSEKTGFEGSGRSSGVAYVVNGNAYVATGQNLSNRWDDIWSFSPDQDFNENR